MQLEKVLCAAGTQATGAFGPSSRFLVALFAATLTLTPPAAVLARQTARTGARATVARAFAGEDVTVRPFRVRVPQKALDDLRRRLAATRGPFS